MTREPVAIAAFIRVVLYAAVAFGLDFTEEQLLALVAVVEAGTALFVRARVTPVADPRL